MSRKKSIILLSIYLVFTLLLRLVLEHALHINYFSSLVLGLVFLIPPYVLIKKKVLNILD
ncbi:hypothetical protein [Lacihabitans sp. LS3-19]|uniref:hypothetical protein n=1 Tax=Lacihabitans sp. LS3-19 TaxID=2487335 RepID=UPI0020CFA30D|nr:hypothetical protein [Lacihabitans sp. LS3-19]